MPIEPKSVIVSAQKPDDPYGLFLTHLANMVALRQTISWVSFVLLTAACTTGSSEDFSDVPSGVGGQTTTAVTVAGSSEASISTGFITTAQASVSTTATGMVCDSPPDQDGDMDGFSAMQGDCNDCDANVNPGAMEVVVTDPDPMGNVPEPADEDCDMMVDNVAPPCDAGLALDVASPVDAAKAIELCKQANSPKDWGLIDAALVHANGTPAALGARAGVMPKFGTIAARGGTNMLVLSTGRARTPSQPGACGGDRCAHSAASAPAGFPSPVPGCAGGAAIFDDAGLEVRLRAPTNATGYTFDFRFFSFEFPEYVCTRYNDQFFVLAAPPPMGAAANGNITFDSLHNPISVNVAYFDSCNPGTSASFAFMCLLEDPSCPPPPSPYCPLGPADLAQTGFDVWGVPALFGHGADAGATSWLQTSAPIGPGHEVTLRFAIFDTEDQQLDSTSLVDRFQWIANGGTVAVTTIPAPPPPPPQ